MQLHHVVTNIEKFTNLRFFFLFSGLIFTLDSIFNFYLGISFFEINNKFLNSNISIILLSLSFFALFAGIVPPVIIFILKFFCTKKDISFFEQSNYIDKNKLLEKALHEKSKVDYILLKDNELEFEKINNLLKSSIIFLSSLILNSFLNNSLMEKFQKYLDVNSILHLLIGLLFLFLIIFINSVVCEITDKIYYPNYSKFKTKD